MDVEPLLDRLRRIPREQLDPATQEQLRSAERGSALNLSIYELPDRQIVILWHQGAAPTREALRRAVEACLAREGRA